MMRLTARSTSTETLFPYTSLFRSRAHPLVQRLTDATEAAGGEVIETSRDILHKLSGKENPQSVLGVYDIQTSSLAEADRASAPLWFVAQSIRDPGNMGQLLLTAAAVGAVRVLPLGEFCAPFSVHACRALMYAI